MPAAAAAAEADGKSKLRPPMTAWRSACRSAASELSIIVADVAKEEEEEAEEETEAEVQLVALGLCRMKLGPDEADAEADE